MNPLFVHTLGVGTWAWGDRLFWGYGRGYGVEDLRRAYRASLEAGLRLFDYLVSKFFPYPWRLSRRDLLRALKGSLGRLGVEALDLYLLH